MGSEILFYDKLSLTYVTEMWFCFSYNLVLIYCVTLSCPGLLGTWHLKQNMFLSKATKILKGTEVVPNIVQKQWRKKAKQTKLTKLNKSKTDETEE